MNAGTQGVALRSAPGTGERLKLLKDGDVLERIGDEEQLAADKRWWKIRDSETTEGWTAIEFLLRDSDVDERGRFLEYGRQLWRLATLSDRSHTALFEAMKNVNTPAQIVAMLRLATENARTQGELQTAARGVSTTERGRKARQTLIDMLGNRRQTADTIVKALGTQNARDVEAARQAITSSQTVMLGFAAEFVALAFELRVDYQNAFKE